MVGRSTQVLLGLERGEQTGGATIRKVQGALVKLLQKDLNPAPAGFTTSALLEELEVRSLLMLDNLEAGDRTTYSRDAAAAVEIGAWVGNPAASSAWPTRAVPRRAEDVEFERLHAAWPRLTPDAGEC